MDQLFEYLSSLLGGGLPKDNYEPIAPLSKEEAKEWDEIHQNLAMVKSLITEAEARKRLFWVKVEKKLNNYGRDLRIENGMVLEKVEEKKNCQSPGAGPRPGFCDGDCAKCAINPNKDEEIPGG